MPLLALELELPSTATSVLQYNTPFSSHRLAVEAWSPTEMPMVAAEGSVTQMVWQVPSFGGTTAQLTDLLSRQITEAGYSALFSCTDRICGGFDFRYALDLALEPIMHVDLGDYTYFAAQRDLDDEIQFVSLVVSKGGSTGYIQLTLVEPQGSQTTTIEATNSSRAPVFVGSENLASNLVVSGSAILEDLLFDTGASALSNDTYPSLVALAQFLRENPEESIVLVGHTDAEGALDQNVRLSRARAQSVREHLIGQLGIPAPQVSAEGVGFLSPRANNTSEDGRDKNRRVEVILTSTR
ncbi:MAG: outer membrane protein OmpA-like peptidoglycan-associated protein [Paracoccaceae bacterium]|jgi:OOP family OmpA-OmpF porin